MTSLDWRSVRSEKSHSRGEHTIDTRLRITSIHSTDYTARTSAALPDDIALSATYIPASNSSYAVFYGCDEDQTRDIVTSLRSAPNGVDHPLLCVGILAELERKRLVDLGEDLLDKFTVNSDTLENYSWKLSTLKMQESLAICVRSHSLKDQIRSVKRQLARVLDELDRLGREEWLSPSALDMGILVKQKIVDTLDEFEDKIDECNMMAENLSLAMQTVSRLRIELPPIIIEEIAHGVLDLLRDGAKQLARIPSSTLNSQKPTQQSPWNRRLRTRR